MVMIWLSLPTNQVGGLKYPIGAASGPVESVNTTKTTDHRGLCGVGESICSTKKRCVRHRPQKKAPR